MRFVAYGFIAAVLAHRAANSRDVAVLLWKPRKALYRRYLMTAAPAIAKVEARKLDEEWGGLDTEKQWGGP